MTITSLAASTVSWMVAHPSIDWAHGCLTSVIRPWMVAPCQRGSFYFYCDKMNTILPNDLNCFVKVEEQPQTANSLRKKFTLGKLKEVYLQQEAEDP